MVSVFGWLDCLRFSETGKYLPSNQNLASEMKDLKKKFRVFVLFSLGNRCLLIANFCSRASLARVRAWYG